jgi:5-methylcytosine-specific restriction endonuclease McrA
MKTCEGCTATLVKKTQVRFCCHSCSASVTNKGTARNRKDAGHCQRCGKPKREISMKYCGQQCFREATKEETIRRWLETGELTESSSLNLPKVIRNYIYQRDQGKCTECGWSKVNPYTGNSPLQVHHVDGDGENNREGNLKLLCPNCHSLTQTFGGANRGKGRAQRRERYKSTNMPP